MVECDFVQVADDGSIDVRRADIVRGMWFPAAPRVGELVSLKDSIFRVAEVLWVLKGITAAAVVYVTPF